MVTASITCLIRLFLVPLHTRSILEQQGLRQKPTSVPVVLRGGLSNPFSPFLSSGTNLAILGPSRGTLYPLVIYCLAYPGAAQHGLSSSVQAWPGLCSWTHDSHPSGDHQGGCVLTILVGSLVGSCPSLTRLPFPCSCLATWSHLILCWRQRH